jgi:tRNA 2-thiouridine synthesizing protein B
MQDRVIDGIKLVDYSGFVDLVAEHPSVQAWL